MKRFLISSSALVLGLSLAGCNLHRADQNTGPATPESPSLTGPQARENDGNLGGKAWVGTNEGTGANERVPNGSSGESYSTTGKSFADSEKDLEQAASDVGNKVAEKKDELTRKLRDGQYELTTKTGMRFLEIKKGNVVTAYKVLYIPNDTSPETMGLKVGDLITEINGRPVRDTEVSLAELQMGSDIGYVKITRGGKAMRLPEGVLSGTSRPQ